MVEWISFLNGPRTLVCCFGRKALTLGRIWAWWLGDWGFSGLVLRWVLKVWVPVLTAYLHQGRQQFIASFGRTLILRNAQWLLYTVEGLLSAGGGVVCPGI